ncbi:T9SS type A sorting domain-containing protein [Ferruginibacter sp. SUN106]|uniref:T9SS type A sorting domain-containing protein n=1 Tax=Ferruginibacter sp. SUN106 TaxID=2978348 RepID=UPI003D36E034
MSRKKIVLFSIVSLFSSLISFSQCGTDPVSGTVTIAAANQIVNSYFAGTGNPAQGSITMTVGAIDARGNATTIGAGDLVLIIQMQGADIDATNTDAYGNGVSGGSASGYLASNLYAGRYEYNTVVSFAANVITFSYGLANNYYTQNFTAGNAIRRYQVIRVPRYFNFTINAASSVTAPAWDGSTGGVVAIDAANTFTNNGSVIATALGFRGGGGKQLTGATAGNTNGATALTSTDYRWNSPVTTAANGTGGAKGEGIAGTAGYVLPQNATTTVSNAVEGYINGSFGRSAGGNGGGGGNDGDVAGNSNNAGGAGGGNGGSGGRGGNSWSTNIAVGGEPGALFAQTSISLIVMGGGGGAGTANNSSAANEYQSSGGCGGGILLLRAKLYAGNGSFVADGGAAPGVVGVGGTTNTDAAGGGGAGGTIIAVTRTTGVTGLALITASAKGGKGGDMTNYYNHGPGGGGGGGIIYSNGSFASTNITAGANGLTRSTSNVGPIDNIYGSAPGTVGFSTLLPSAPVIRNYANGASPCGVLPIKIQSFYGVNKAGVANLFWQVDMAVNFAKFEIEYSTDGTSFTYAGKVDYSSSKTSYTFLHPLQNASVVYYRLKMINESGSYTYSDVIKIRTTTDAAAVLFPNPAGTKTTLQFAGNITITATLTVFDQSGKKVAETPVLVHNGNNFIPVDCSRFAAGGYLVKVTDINGTVVAKERLIVASAE